MYKRQILESTGNAGVAILAALAVGIGCGAVNGFFVAVCEIPPFISTLGMMTLLRGCILVYTKGSPIPIKVDAYKFFGKGTVAGVPVPVIILIILFLIAHYVLTPVSYTHLLAMRCPRPPFPLWQWLLWWLPWCVFLWVLRPLP